MKILIADDHLLFADSFKLMLERKLLKVTCKHVVNVDDAFAHIDQYGLPDLLLLDFRMPGMSGFSGLSKIMIKYPKLKVALLSGHAEDNDVARAVELGVCAYLPKTMSSMELVEAVQRLMEGEKYFPAGKGDAQYAASYEDDGEDMSGASEEYNKINEKIATLSRRENEILGYIAQGSSNKEISEQCGIKISTVKLHVSHICSKLEVVNRTQAALMAKAVNFS